MTVKLFEDESMPLNRVSCAEPSHAALGEDGVWHLSPELMAALRQVHLGQAKLEEVK